MYPASTLIWIGVAFFIGLFVGRSRSSRQSKTFGDKSVQHFNRVKQELSKPVPDGNLDKRLDNLEKGFIELSEGMIQLRNQIGSLVGMVNISILLNERTDIQISKFMKRK